MQCRVYGDQRVEPAIGCRLKLTWAELRDSLVMASRQPRMPLRNKSVNYPSILRAPRCFNPGHALLGSLWTRLLDLVRPHRCAPAVGAVCEQRWESSSHDCRSGT